MKWLMKRLREPSTYSGLGALVASVGVLGKVDEAPLIANAIANEGMIYGGMLASVMGMFVGEKADG